MNDVIDQIHKAGFNIESLIFDNQFHRFTLDDRDDRESGWYICYNTKVVIVGSFRTGGHQAFYSNENLSSQQKGSITKLVKTAQEHARVEISKINEQAATRTLCEWDNIADDGSLSPYQIRKKIKQKYGTKCHKDNCYVPMVDIEGKLWGMQTILPKKDKKGRDKFFQSGQKKRGTFHLIGEIENVLYICEGFATGASIFQAMELPVVIAFDSGNLSIVAEIFREKYHDLKIIICGDNDHKTLNNPGKIAAEKAANISKGIAIYPQCDGTDFNDLHCEKGLNEVFKQISEKQDAKITDYIKPLGYDGSSYFFISSVNKQIQELSVFSLNTFSRLQPLDYWQKHYTDLKSKHGFDATLAADELMQGCHKKGIFQPDKKRGQGVWIDNQTIVYHKGDSLFYDGKNHDLCINSLDSDFIYEKQNKMPDLHESPLEDGHALLDVCSLIKFKNPEDSILFSGWLAVAAISGALQWRSHLYLTGASGTGKSYIMQEIVNVILKNYAIFYQGTTTEAGIRQAVKGSTKPIIFDEFEINEARSHERIKAILELARQASSESDAVVAKGTTSGKVNIQFRPRFPMLVSSVRPGLEHEEDKNRFTILQLTRNSNAEHFEELKNKVFKIQGNYGQRLFSRMFYKIPELIKSIDIIRSILGPKYGMRFAQQYGNLLAGHWMLLSDEVITIPQAEKFCDAIKIREENRPQEDEHKCIDFIYETLIKTDDGNRSVFEMLENSKFEPDLLRLGLIYNRNEKTLFIYLNSTQIKNIYKNTAWVTSFGETLSRLPNAKAVYRKINNRTKRGLLINILA